MWPFNSPSFWVYLPSSSFRRKLSLNKIKFTQLSNSDIFEPEREQKEEFVYSWLLFASGFSRINNDSVFPRFLSIIKHWPRSGCYLHSSATVQLLTPSSLTFLLTQSIQAVQKTTADREMQQEVIRPAERHQAALCPPWMTSFTQCLFSTYPSSTPDVTWSVCPGSISITLKSVCKDIDCLLTLGIKRLICFLKIYDFPHGWT